MASTALVVLTSPALLRLVGSFQRGLPAKLWLFWRALDPRAALAFARDDDLLVANAAQLGGLVVAKGSLRLLEMFVRLSESNHLGFVATPSEKIAHDAIYYNRADMLAWAIRHDDGSLNAETLWTDAIRWWQAGETDVLDTLLALKAVAPGELSRILGQRSHHLDDFGIVKWFDQNVPRFVFTSPVVTNATRSHDFETVRFLCEREPPAAVSMGAIAVTVDRKQWEMAALLLARFDGEMDPEVAKKMAQSADPAVRQIMNDYLPAFL